MTRNFRLSLASFPQKTNEEKEEEEEKSDEKNYSNLICESQNKFALYFLTLF